jgi:hypothetical protein
VDVVVAVGLEFRGFIDAVQGTINGVRNMYPGVLYGRSNIDNNTGWMAVHRCLECVNIHALTFG